jgi:CHAD domain-containing protein
MQCSHRGDPQDRAERKKENSARIRSYLKRNILSFENLQKKTHQNPSIVRVHKLRVAARRILTVLWIVKADPNSPSFHRLIRSLGALAKNLGALRDVDVACKDSPRYGLDTFALRKKRRKYKNVVQDNLTSGRREKFALALKRSSRSIRNLSNLNVRKSYVKLGKRVAQWAKNPLTNEDGVHAFRIDMKRTRYAMEAAGLSSPSLKKLQDLLGKAHDLEVLQKLQGRHARIRRDELILHRKVRGDKQQILHAMALELKELIK